MTYMRMSRVEASGVHSAHSELHPNKRKKISSSSHIVWKKQHERGQQRVQRAVRKYPEDAEEHLEIGHRHISIPMERAECSCPEVLARGTLGAIVAALAFLGFFSTSVLLVVAVCVLRLVEKQRKTGKEGKVLYPPSRRIPPVPPPRPDHTYMDVKSHGYERLHPATPRYTTEGAYLSPSELNPGPRTTQNLHYSKMKSGSSHSKSTRENDPRRVQPYSTPPLVNKYANVEDTQSPARMQGSPDIGMTPRGRESHIYEEVE